MHRARILLVLLLGASLSAFSCSSPSQAEHHRFVVVPAEGMSVVLVERVLTTDHERGRSITSRTPAAVLAIPDSVIEFEGGPAFDRASFACRSEGGGSGEDTVFHTLQWADGGLTLDDLPCDVGGSMLLVTKHGPGGALVPDRELTLTSEAEERAFLHFDVAAMVALVRTSIEARSSGTLDTSSAALGLPEDR